MADNTVARPLVESFFHEDTATFSYVVHDGPESPAAIVDPVLDFDPASGRTSTASADALLAWVERRQLDVHWILETHAHADHLSAGGYLHDVLRAPLAIGAGITGIQERFGRLFGLGAEFVPDGRQFNRLFMEGDTFRFGRLEGHVLATPGHTDDSLTYVIGDAAFVGDTLFAPDVGTARADFPGGDAATLYRSIRKILSLPRETRLFLCHDYPREGREPTPETSVAAELADNVHIGGGRSEADYVALRTARDATLPVPRLILPSLQVNIRGGRLPEPDPNGIRYLRLPLNALGQPSGKPETRS